MERSTIFNGNIHYFDWAIFHCYVSSPEGRWRFSHCHVDDGGIFIPSLGATTHRVLNPVAISSCPYNPIGVGYTLWWTYKKLLNMAIEIVNFPIKKWWIFPLQTVSSPEGRHECRQGVLLSGRPWKNCDVYPKAHPVAHEQNNTSRGYLWTWKIWVGMFSEFDDFHSSFSIWIFMAHCFQMERPLLPKQVKLWDHNYWQLGCLLKRGKGKLQILLF